MILSKLCRKGLHEMTPENTCVSPAGKRHCRACRRKRNRRTYNKRTTGFTTEAGRIVGLGECLICGREWRQEDIILEPGTDRRLCRGCLEQSNREFEANFQKQQPSAIERPNPDV